MSKLQKSIIIRGFFDKEHKWHDNNNEVNDLLNDGWKVIISNPMGAYGYCYGYPGSSDTFGNEFSQNGFASILILEKTSD